MSIYVVFTVLDYESVEVDGEIEMKLIPVGEIVDRDCEGIKSCIAEKR